MRILITGASGFLGRGLAKYLGERGHAIVPLVRGSAGTGRAFWNPDRDQIDLAPADALDAVIHLAGENIAQRWNERAKERIYQSRVRGTALLCRAVAGLARRPQVLLCASGTGYYGSRGDEILDENSSLGAGFLAKVCQDWEAACEPARAAGIRVVNLRFGLVLHPKGGALAKMLPAFRLGLGGKLGSGKHYWSWIAYSDVLGATEFVLNNPRVSGPVNMVGPTPVTNEAFTKTLGAALGRPTFMTMPRFALRILAGGMADEALLASFRVLPTRLAAAGYPFTYQELRPALESLLLNHTAA